MIWKQTALQSLIRLDAWREENGWSAIAEIKGMPVNMRMTLIRPGKSDPYKVFLSV
jgi:hypothetical protein